MDVMEKDSKGSVRVNAELRRYTNLAVATIQFDFDTSGYGYLATYLFMNVVMKKFKIARRVVDYYDCDLFTCTNQYGIFYQALQKCDQTNRVRCINV